MKHLERFLRGLAILPIVMATGFGLVFGLVYVFLHPWVFSVCLVIVLSIFAWQLGKDW